MIENCPEFGWLPKIQAGSQNWSKKTFKIQTFSGFWMVSLVVWQDHLKTGQSFPTLFGWIQIRVVYDHHCICSQFFSGCTSLMLSTCCLVTGQLMRPSARKWWTSWATWQSGSTWLVTHSAKSFTSKTHLLSSCKGAANLLHNFEKIRKILKMCCKGAQFSKNIVWLSNTSFLLVYLFQQLNNSRRQSQLPHILSECVHKGTNTSPPHVRLLCVTSFVKLSSL